MQILIRLMSDLCVSSGQGVGTAVDTDVTYDAAGYPYIGARRLKGCLREAALFIGCPAVDEIFGIPGARDSGALKLSNALLTAPHRLDDPAMTAEQRIGAYTYVRAQTAMEAGAVKDGSLRFTRVVGRYSPIAPHGPLEFSAVCECDGYEDEMAKICMALRNIGLMRTRGLGSVRCELAQTEDAMNVTAAQADISGMCELRYTIKLRDPLVIRARDGDETLDFIPGRMVLGALAGAYLRRVGLTDDAFTRLFLSDAVMYSNLYPADPDGTAYIPAPAFLHKIKYTAQGKETASGYPDGTIVSVAYEAKRRGESLKPVKDGYCDAAWHLHYPRTEINYHHSRYTDRPAEQRRELSTLYTETSLCAGQVYSGGIRCDGRDAKLLAELLGSSIRLGRSKSAQYAACEVIRCETSAECMPKKRSGKLVFTLESDVMLEDVSFAGLCEEIRKAVPITPCGLYPDPERFREDDSAILFYTNVGGYHAGRGHREVPRRVIAKGSVLCAYAENVPERFRIGEYRNEGYGVIRVYKYEELEKIGAGINPDTPACPAADNALEECRMRAIEAFRRHERLFCEADLNAAFVDRIALMVRQAENYDDLILRVESIKTESRRQKVLDLLDGCRDENWREYYTLLFRLAKYKLYGGTGE